MLDLVIHLLSGAPTARQSLVAVVHLFQEGEVDLDPGVVCMLRYSLAEVSEVGV